MLWDGEKTKPNKTSCVVFLKSLRTLYGGVTKECIQTSLMIHMLYLNTK
jgi:hypothetical protein